MIKLTKKTAGIAVAGVLAVTGVSAYALNSPDQIGASDVPPIVEQVNDHEQRIGNLEQKTDDIQTQVDQNSTVLGTHTTNSTTSLPTSNDPENTPTTNNTTEQAPTVQPTPEPSIDPYTIMTVVATPKPSMPGSTTCLYTLQNGKQKIVNNGNNVPCFEEGTIIPYAYRPR